jgi:opacity protein-like surface antigen
MFRKILLATLITAFACTAAFAASVDGKWKATFDTQMGTQNYTYEFHVDGNKVTGTATNDRGQTPITEGKLDGDTITFVEALSFNGNDIRIEYTGKIDGDQIKFTRKIGDFATEELVAKRLK